MAPATGTSHVPLTERVGSADNVWSVQQAVLHAVRSLQTVFRPSSPRAPCPAPPTGLAEVSLVKAISTDVMAQMSGIR